MRGNKEWEGRVKGEKRQMLQDLPREAAGFGCGTVHGFRSSGFGGAMGNESSVGVVSKTIYDKRTWERINNSFCKFCCKGKKR